MASAIAIAGITGNVGASVARSLIARNVTCRAVVRDPAEAQRKLPDIADSALCSFVQGDFDGAGPARGLFDDVAGLFLMRPPQIGDVKRLMFPFLRAAQEAGVPRVVFLSLLVSLLGANVMPFILYRKPEKGWDPDYVAIVSRLFITVRLGLASKTTGEPGDLLDRSPTTLDRYIQDYLEVWT